MFERFRAAYSAFFKAHNTERLPGGSSFNSLMGMATQTDQQSQMQAQTNSAWLFAIIDRIASAVASTDWMLFKRMPDENHQEQPDHPLLKLWESVNPFFTGVEFLELSINYFLTTGEIWWVIARDGSGVPQELWPIRPDQMKPIPHRTEYIVGYEYRRGNEAVPLEIEDVIFTRRPSPLNPYRGIGVIQALLVDIGSERAAAQWTRSFFQNSAEPGGIIEYEDGLSDSEFDTLVQRWKIQHQGVANAHRVAILEKGTWKDRKLTQRDMQFEQLRKLNRDLMLGAFGMPLSALGITETVNRANAEAGEVLFTKWLVKPLLTRIKASLNERLVPPFGDDLFFNFVDPTPLNRELDIEEGERGYTAGILTRNEARKRFSEDEAEEGGDEFAPAPGGGDFGLSAGDGIIKSPVMVKASIEQTELRILDNWAKRLKREVEALTLFLAEFFKGIQKLEPSDVAGYDWDWWQKYGDDVIEELTEAFTAAILDAHPAMMPMLAHDLAVQYAENRGARLIRLDGDLNIAQATRNRVNSIVGSAIERGDGLGTIQKSLREDFAFSRNRASMIARTETATAQGQGAKQAAIVQERDEKNWISQGDDRVDSAICIENEAQGWLPASDLFQSGHDTIPGHPNCRCNVRYRTKPPVEVESIPMGETRCPNPGCNFLLGKGAVSGFLWCHKCNMEVKVLPPSPIGTEKVVTRDPDTGRITSVKEVPAYE